MAKAWKWSSGVTREGLRSLTAWTLRLSELCIAIYASAEVVGFDTGEFELAPGYAMGDGCMAFRLDLLDSKIGSEYKGVAACLADTFCYHDLHLEDTPLAWGFQVVPPDLFAECMMFQSGWKEVTKLPYEATEEAREGDYSDPNFGDSDDSDDTDG
ncbi:hypothetical protein CONPUDRAFT_159125 [Coniophora puteana RWD-64-598 SS2]|uniref:Uncharacterized protein n=1 Tax=Coniophora puteana (strain RWD-64-598) TaxID=741705 RepID=A0A5M3MAM8_CONPW|nr:uncharacterized protein CONPUDRAFT_159125 [Coniophora puteana RWD-64-598 SS2]EIW75691.1 hypothetical protein CONPUDRAFT_159125 [Coniophora puteana RWD-64-598 SS2]